MERLRRYPRIEDRSRIVLLSHDLKQVLVRAEIRILGMGGCLLVSGKQIDVNREFPLVIYLGAARFAALGKLLYRYTSDREPGKTLYGIKFIQVKTKSVRRQRPLDKLG